MSYSAWSTIIETILKAGTWTNYTLTPIISIISEDSIRKRTTYIGLLDELEDPIYDFTGSEIYATKSGTIQINAVNKTDRNKIYMDIKNILKASSYGFNIEDALPEAPQKNRFGHNIKVDIID